MRTIEITCHNCKKHFSITMTDQQYKDYNEGCYVQEIFPEKTADERELLISGMCGNCFDNMFK